MASAPTPDAALQAKADEKLQVVQTMIRAMERAISRCDEQDRRWLQNILDPRQNDCFPTLIRIILEKKYRSFIPLRCVALRAVQLMLRIASTMIPGADPGVGMLCLVDLAGDDLAGRMFAEVIQMAEHQGEPLVSCNALILLGELGPEALGPELVARLLDLFVALPDRADDLVEVVLRFHAWGGRHRAALLSAVVFHVGGKLLCEVLLQVINRADEKRRLRALKVLAGCLANPSSGSLLYTNDARVLVEILLRELPNHAGDATAFACHAECFKALVGRCTAARMHRQHEALQVFQDLSLDESNAELVRCESEAVLAFLAESG